METLELSVFGRLAQDPLARLPVQYGGLYRGIKLHKMEVKRHKLTSTKRMCEGKNSISVGMKQMNGVTDWADLSKLDHEPRNHPCCTAEAPRRPRN